ncbi:hypothetical protein Y032_0262g580 [Ancylostoma ceylanicum]|uniref:SAP domain-containing protein n=1 Tax=Ancylostoma ceylanicum TaxID=53326 RepID=A0A016SA12_9BILA|nr:hypothetical protein Y032_0262g580 [Ancylostoma ceylanicum]
MSPAPSTSKAPRPILPRTSAQRAPETPGTSEGLPFSGESTRRGWATARGEQLRKKIEQRPSRERLLNQHILLSDGRVAPLIEQRARLLRQDRIRRNLSRKLEARPGPLELVTRKILQADADLEQAIEEGRVLFQPTSEYVEEEESEMPSPLSTDMEIVSQAAIRAQNKPVNVLSNKGIIRKKSTPYKQCDPLPLRAKTKAPDSKEDDEVTVIGEVKSPMEQTPKSSEQNNYELLLQQQKLFLQWQHNDENPSQAQVAVQDNQMQMYDMQPASPAETSPNNQVTIRRLSDYKVQELKNECKKRQLPVSGAKPQLLERLRPFEKAILGASPPPTPEPVQFTSTNNPTISNSNVATSTTSTVQELQQPPPQEVQEPVMQAAQAAHCQPQAPPMQVQQQPQEQDIHKVEMSRVEKVLI